MAANYFIREASLADIPLLHHLASLTWAPTYGSILPEEQVAYMFEVIYTETALQQQVREGQTFLLLYAGDKPVGFASFSEKEAAAKVYKLNKLYLLPDCQGSGLGKKLITFVEKEVKKRGAAILDLNVNRYNKAKAFYEHCGYHAHLQEDIPIGPYWMNDYVMRKQL
ncbi:GNAT family N-acetyltransferase [Pontibacter sp. 172403-2]|uniref:GNAT family N-acetyltransferase n=1 Tax=Pontibacter rufus TaxID=2791028 RepID=UPI0018AF7BA2|nr:GNAT family N-acetyltransferase [Pontibacter sp. 172403-2]MBF9253987.1 GNAT family N-acetyltransferase [Pontibacter sp. 172403-2]